MFGSPCAQSFVTVPLLSSSGDVQRDVLQRNAMNKYSGTVHKNDLEGGFWELRTSDGQRFQLRAEDRALLVEGQQVEIDGKEMRPRTATAVTDEDGYFDMPGGQSGHPLSPYYGSGHNNWVKGEPTPFLPGPSEQVMQLLPPS